MPRAPKVPCRNHHQGCPNLVDPAFKAKNRGYCPVCLPQAHVRYNRLNRDRTAQSLYNTPRWRKLSRSYRARQPVCELCGHAPSQHTDHIEPHRNLPHLFWSQTNWQALCHSCHSKKTASEDGGFGNPTTPTTPRRRG